MFAKTRLKFNDILANKYNNNKIIDDLVALLSGKMLTDKSTINLLLLAYYAFEHIYVYILNKMYIQLCLDLHVLIV